MYIGLLEDEPHLAQHVCEILEKAGHSTSLFTNGADMIKAIGRDTIDLFVLDWGVPRVSGLEANKNQLDKNIGHRHNPIRLKKSELAISLRTHLSKNSHRISPT